MKKQKVCFYLKGDKKNQNGETAIYGKIYLGNDYSTFSTSKYILKERWSKTNGLKNTLRVDNEINLKNYLDSLSKSIEKKYIDLKKSIEKNIEITPLSLKIFCFNKNPEYKISLLEIVTKHNQYFKKQVKKGDRADGSLEKYERMGDVILDYLQTKHKLKDIDFDKINRPFVYGLDEFLRFDRKHGKKTGLANNTTVKYIRNISAMVNHVKKNGLVTQNPFDIYDGKLKEIETTFLTLQELKRIENKVFTNRRLDITRYIFLFSCYTSYAPIDVMNLRLGNYSLDDGLDNLEKPVKLTTLFQCKLTTSFGAN